MLNNDSDSNKRKITWIFLKCLDKPDVKEFKRLLKIKKGNFIKKGGEFDLVIDMIDQINSFMKCKNISDALFDDSNISSYVFTTDEICTKDFLLLRYGSDIVAGYVASPVDIGVVGEFHNDLRELAIKSMKSNNFLKTAEEEILEELDSNHDDLIKIFDGNPFDELCKKINNYYNPKIDKIKNEIIEWHTLHFW